MELEAAKMIGAGLAVIGLSGVGVGIGNIFSSLISSIARNPASSIARNPATRPQIFPMAMLGFALVEAVALYALLISFLVLFG
jgi:F-type H+-transporting ATPase subunit c